MIKWILVFFCLFSTYLSSDTVAIIADSIGEGVKGQKPYPLLLENYYNAFLEKDIIFVKSCRGGTCVESGFKRLENILKECQPDFLIYTLGINDCLSCKTPIKALYQDLCKTMKLAQENNIQVLLGTIDASFYHPVIKDHIYEKEFEDLYLRLKNEFGVILFPFLYRELIEDPTLTYDKVHPNDIGQLIITANIVDILSDLIEEKNE